MREDFLTMIRVFEITQVYEEKIRYFSTPKKYKYFSESTARWGSTKLHVFNSDRDDIDEMVGLCKEYLRIMRKHKRKIDNASSAST